MVGPDALRFDFAHFQPLTGEELHRVEARVNELVRQNAGGQTDELAIEDARKTGAMMIFGEKYGETVRVVTLGPSKELCGGTHVRRTGDIAFFKIASEESIAAGVRRIVAHTGPRAVELAQRIEDELKRSAGLLRVRRLRGGRQDRGGAAAGQGAGAGARGGRRQAGGGAVGRPGRAGRARSAAPGCWR